MGSKNHYRSAEAEEAELDPNNNSSKRIKTETSASAKVAYGVGKPKFCHQCRKDDSYLVECNKCQWHSYCVDCCNKWYPGPHASMRESCPVCSENCNCTTCLLDVSPKCMQAALGYSYSEHDKAKYSKYILQKLFPLLKCLNEEQLIEKSIEAKFNGLSLSDLQLEDSDIREYEEIHCCNCGAYLFDLYRSCECGYELCLACCGDVRKGVICKWKSHVDGSIPCPPKDIGGCGNGILELMRIKPVDWVANTFKEAQGIYEVINQSDDIPETCTCNCTCYDSGNETVGDNGKLQKEAMQEKRYASNLYSPIAKDIQPQDMKHFQLHWSKGEPIIVSDVLSTTTGLSWDPMVLWRVFRDVTKRWKPSQACKVNAVNCLDWSEVSIDLYNLVKSYSKFGFYRDMRGWDSQSQVLKLEDWQPCFLSKEECSRHFREFMSFLPLKDYTHPEKGYLNVASKWPDFSHGKPDMRPRMGMACGEGFKHDASVTKLHYNRSDTVNVLVHTHRQYLTDMLGIEKCVYKDGKKLYEEGGAMWDIFSRQDIPKLEKYLKNHSAEFMHAGNHSAEQVIHPIHDQRFYLNKKHKKKLKEEFGIEPWTFRQRLGDAVFIPAGCPCQVHNLKSCTKIELDFFSPESLEECIRLHHELCMLPDNHRDNKERLNIMKMMLYALDLAVADLSGITDSDSDQPTADHQYTKVPDIINGRDTNISDLYDTEANRNDDDDADADADDIDVNDDVETINDQEAAGALEDTGTSSMPTNMPDKKTLEDPCETGGLWRGHDVGKEAKELLDAIEHRYPNTFQGVRIRWRALWLPILKEFHVIIKGFLETYMDSLTEEQMPSLEEDLKEFERFGFDLSWVHKRLDMVKKLKFGNDPLPKELMALEESLVERWKQLVEACEI